MTRISVPLSVDGLGQAIREIEAYKLNLRQKTEQLAQLVAERIRDEAQAGFSGALADDIIHAPQLANVSVTVEGSGNLLVVLASGEDAVWVEFGAGVYYNGAVGQSPNPLVAQNGLPFTIGGYDKGHGRQNAWGWIDEESQELRISRGTPATMPMYHAVQNVISIITDLAQEVFSE